MYLATQASLASAATRASLASVASLASAATAARLERLVLVDIQVPQVFQDSADILAGQATVEFPALVDIQATLDILESERADSLDILVLGPAASVGTVESLERLASVAIQVRLE